MDCEWTVYSIHLPGTSPVVANRSQSFETLSKRKRDWSGRVRLIKATHVAQADAHHVGGWLPPRTIEDGEMMNLKNGVCQV